MPSEEFEIEAATIEMAFRKMRDKINNFDSYSEDSPWFEVTTVEIDLSSVKQTLSTYGTEDELDLLTFVFLVTET